MSRRSVIRDHIPSISSADEELIESLRHDPEADVADLAIRTCKCGEHIDGFYEYTSHLLEQIEREESDLRAKIESEFG